MAEDWDEEAVEKLSDKILNGSILPMLDSGEDVRRVFAAVLGCTVAVASQTAHPAAFAPMLRDAADQLEDGSAESELH